MIKRIPSIFSAGGIPATAGILFFAANAWVSYQFYHANSHKILIVLIGVTLLFLQRDLLSFKSMPSGGNWRHYGVLFIPLIVTFPGLLYYRGGHNYNFAYELTTNLVLILWSIYLIRSVRFGRDLKILIVFVGITIIYVSIYAGLEWFNLNPLQPFDENISRVKATFGNTNYFAGFLIVLIPLFFSLLLPFEKKESGLQFWRNWLLGRWFYLSVAVSAAFSLYLTQTRAAIASCVLALVLITIVWMFLRLSWKRRFWILIIAVFLAFALSLAIALLLVFREQLPWISELIESTRFGSLFLIKVWFSRTISWQTAVDSILASPWVGYGLGSSYNLFFLFRNPEDRLFTTEHSYNHVHSEILEFTQEAGLLGLVGLAVFWIVIARMLWGVVRSPKNGFMLQVAIGICGGFLAYGIQGMFSVAPRMMVTRLPVFTLMAFAFILHLGRADREREVRFGFKKALSASAFLVGILVVCHSMYVPWILRQKEVVDLLGQRKSLLHVEEYERRIHSWSSSDIYALYHLFFEQRRYRRKAEYQKTLHRMEEIIPHYRDTGYHKAAHFLEQGDLERAKKLAFQYQDRDRYHRQNIFLLCNIAIYTNDANLFFEQLKLLLKSSLVKHDAIAAGESHLLETSVGRDDTFLKVEIGGGSYKVALGAKLIGRILEIAQTVRKRSAWTADQLNQFRNSIRAVFLQDTFFDLTVEHEYQEEKDRIQKSVDLYLQMEERQKELNWSFDRRYRREMSSGGWFERKRRHQKLQTEHEKLVSPYREKLKEQRKYLEKTTDWKEFRKKRAFMLGFVETLSSLVFPPEMAERRNRGP